MKTFLSVLTLVVLAAGAAVASEAPSAQEPAKEPAVPQEGEVAAPEAPGSAPEPLPMNHCTAHQDCSDGSQVTCTGHSSCFVGSNYVECDGNRTSCPPDACTVSTTCCTGQRVSCSGAQCTVREGRSVICRDANGNIIDVGFCPFCPEF